MTGTRKEDEIPEKVFWRDYGGQRYLDEAEKDARGVSRDLVLKVFGSFLILGAGLPLFLIVRNYTNWDPAVAISVALGFSAWLVFTKYKFFDRRSSK